MFKNNIKFTRATQKWATKSATLHSWYSYDVTIVVHYYKVVIEGI